MMQSIYSAHLPMMQQHVGVGQKISSTVSYSLHSAIDENSLENTKAAQVTKLVLPRPDPTNSKRQKKNMTND